MKLRRKFVCSYLALTGVVPVHAAELSTVEVRARVENMEGMASAGSEGAVSGARLSSVPILRPGEVLEMVPGLIVTQHAGDGKANQYFLRGFNLDHGTDFATWVAGVPVNMPTHAHGQGYTDLNFLIPELVDRIHYRKGPYFAEEGDFSSAGAAHIDYVRRLPGHLAQITVGQHGYGRTLLAGSPDLARGSLLYALEAFHNDGPWTVPEHYRRLNGVLRYSEGTRFDGWSVTAMRYRGQWVSTDQVPLRAIESGRLGRYDSLDPTAGGRTWRDSLSANWATRGAATQTQASVWWLRSGLDLWSNFQYALNDTTHGDQFKQAERRQAAGLGVSHALETGWAGFAQTHSVGVQLRQDRLAPVGLYRTQNRSQLSTTREDRVLQRSIGLWAQNEWRWTPWLRSIAGLRADAYRFDVQASDPANAGVATDQIVTPRFSLVFGPWQKTEFYLNYGHGFHSNDARGATITRDPVSGEAVDKVKPLVRTRGAELGLRSEILPGWQSTVALWQLSAASELLFVGDAGTTEASRPSLRRGVEWTNLYTFNDWLAVDADLAWSRARFRDENTAGPFIPGAVTTTANLGVTVDNLGPWFGSFRLRYFGPRPLLEDNSVRSASSALSNFRVGYKVDRRTQVALDVYNLFDRKLNDIEYWYCSRVPGEAASASGCVDGTADGYDGRHIHPAEPRSLRLTLRYQY